MRIDFHGKPVDERQIRAGFIGCGSHSFRNIYPTFQFTPVELVATCDLAADKAQTFAAQFGAKRAYTDYHKMLKDEDLEAVFAVTDYDETGRRSRSEASADDIRTACRPRRTSRKPDLIRTVLHFLSRSSTI